jgi:hypothetical protein
MFLFISSVIQEVQRITLRHRATHGRLHCPLLVQAENNSLRISGEERKVDGAGAMPSGAQRVWRAPAQADRNRKVTALGTPEQLGEKRLQSGNLSCLAGKYQCGGLQNCTARLSKSRWEFNASVAEVALT